MWRICFNEELDALLTSLNDQYTEVGFAQLETQNVNATMGREFFFKCLVAVVTACVLILVYVAPVPPYRRSACRRVRGLRAANDLIVVFGSFVILRIPLNGNFVVAMLTILGYSINSTVVIYDRVRENRKLMGNKATLGQLMDQSVHQSLRRSVNTTVTTCLALGVV